MTLDGKVMLERRFAGVEAAGLFVGRSELAFGTRNRLARAARHAH